MICNFKKYRYLCQGNPEVPATWEPLILTMLEKLDAIARHKFIPRFFLNYLSRTFPQLLEEFMPSIYITQIKQKFGALRVYGVFTDEAQEIINKTIAICDDTCEFCGNNHTSHVMVKSWVRNLCTTCKEVKKYGSNN